jgi:hypothetical protein
MSSLFHWLALVPEEPGKAHAKRLEDIISRQGNPIYY